MDKDLAIPPGQELPSQASWDEMVRAADRIQIFEGGAVFGKPLGTQVLFDSRRREDLESLQACVRFREDAKVGNCMCMGSLAFVFSQGEERLAVLGFHHGQSFRWDRWFGDGPLLENEGILNWLSERGIPGPSLEIELMKQLQALQKMYMAAPVCLARFQNMLSHRASQTLWVLSNESQHLPPSPWKGEVERLQQKYPIEFLQRTVEENHPNPQERALLLFRWYGHFCGSWNGFPAFEAEPAMLLLQMPLEVLLQTIESIELSPQELEGAAHHFGSPQFAAHFGTAWEVLPEHLIQRLLEHALQTVNKGMASRAFVPGGGQF